jgi:hexokinase
MDAVFSEIARRTGLLGVDDQWEILVARAKNMVEKALNGEQREAFRLLPTYISAASSATSARNAIVVDIGGTSTKVGILESAL